MHVPVGAGGILLHHLGSSQRALAVPPLGETPALIAIQVIGVLPVAPYIDPAVSVWCGHIFPFGDDRRGSGPLAAQQV
jgi:hypothetical protein